MLVRLALGPTNKSNNLPSKQKIQLRYISRQKVFVLFFVNCLSSFGPRRIKYPTHEGILAISTNPSLSKIYSWNVWISLFKYSFNNFFSLTLLPFDGQYKIFVMGSWPKSSFLLSSRFNMISNVKYA